jgi:hypothetical protein
MTNALLPARAPGAPHWPVTLITEGWSAGPGLQPPAPPGHTTRTLIRDDGRLRLRSTTPFGGGTVQIELAAPTGSRTGTRARWRLIADGAPDRVILAAARAAAADTDPWGQGDLPMAQSGWTETAEYDQDGYRLQTRRTSPGGAVTLETIAADADTPGGYLLTARPPGRPPWNASASATTPTRVLVALTLAAELCCSPDR